MMRPAASKAVKVKHTARYRNQWLGLFAAILERAVDDYKFAYAHGFADGTSGQFLVKNGPMAAMSPEDARSAIRFFDSEEFAAICRRLHVNDARARAAMRQMVTAKTERIEG